MNEGIENDVPKPINPEDIEDLDGAIDKAVSELQENVLEHNELVEGIDFHSLDAAEISEIEEAYEGMRERLNGAFIAALGPAVAGCLFGGIALNTLGQNMSPTEINAVITGAGLGVGTSVVMAASIGIAHLINKIKAVKS